MKLSFISCSTNSLSGIFFFNFLALVANILSLVLRELTYLTALGSRYLYPLSSTFTLADAKNALDHLDGKRLIFLRLSLSNTSQIDLLRAAAVSKSLYSSDISYVILGVSDLASTVFI
jgi:hypothetical protein